MWYPTEEEAQKACPEKEKEYGRKFKPMKDTSAKDVWWAQRVE